MKGLITSERNGVEHQFSDDGWFNATLASRPFNKRPIDWLRLDETKNYISALCEQLGISEPKSLIKAKRNSGTWLHPKLAVPFARWLDTHFGVWCDLQIDQLLRGKHPVLDKKRLRHQTASTFKALTAVLQQTLEQQGKEAKRHHFMNEARLINWALNGEFKGLDRDSLSYEDLDLLASLEVQDLILIASKCTYEERKTALQEHTQQVMHKPTQSITYASMEA
ncbi:KilA-N domain-containing protein [Acinetobacter sp. B5B]|uniref:KilA-N domain-containing protein n=1 Tax=Acinetobacter baretiae TaxID=2605383 RepID=UPI0018C22515|nr:KilA-N domain-containing protein [Acinetobacter baretiae]MBF7683784.1 KilA-N domain-containing protein [Acinetobacter baretiae]